MNYRRLTFSFLIISIGFFISPPGIAASTFVNLDIEQDSTWTLVDSPYIVQSNVTVFPGVTLTIESGVVVKFDGTGLGIFGDVVAEGTDTQPIYFTSFYDDEIATEVDDEEFCFEDVDEAGNSLGEICEIFDWGDPVVGDWGGFYIENSQNSSFKNVFFRYANTVMTTNSSNIHFENLDIKDSGDGFVAFNNSSLTLLDASITCDSEGILVFQNSKLNFSNGFVLCDDYGIYLFDNGEANIDNIKVSGARQVGIMAFRNTNPSGININKSEITENDYGFIIFETPISVHESGIYGNATNGIIAFDPLTPNQFNFANNYWGDSSGPYNESLNPEGLGNEVYGDVLFEPWCESETCKVRNPVIIVPGLLGTEIIKPTADGPEKLWMDVLRSVTDIGDEFMDALQFNKDMTPLDVSLVIGDVIGKITVAVLGFEPKLFDYTESLLEEFDNQGYVEGTDLFLFPYDWRFGVRGDNVNNLKQKIADVLTQTNSDKVDVIVHSTGGLLLKKYVVENPTDHHVDKAVFVGVPNTGAPKAIKALIQGDSFGVPLLSEKEMKKVAANLPVTYDLSPSEQYFNKKGSYVKVVDQYAFSNEHRDLNFEESNIFIVNDHKLNAQALVNAHNLHTEEFDNYDLQTVGVDLYSINGCKAGTIGKFIEYRYHGIFGGDSYAINNFKIEQVPGDGTVPLESATNLPIKESNKYYALNASHAQMMSQDGIRQKIVNILSGSELETTSITQDISKCELNGRAVSVFSPLSIDIVDQDGNHAGLASDGVSIENNIPNADFQIIDDHKFVYLPTDEGQTYTISLVGTGTGTFTITDANINSSNITQTQVFSNISVTPSLLGHINLNTTTTLTLDTNGDGLTDQTLTPSSVLDATESQNFAPEEPVDVEESTTSGSTRSARTSTFIASENIITTEEVDEIPTLLSDVLAQVPVLQSKSITASSEPSPIIPEDLPEKSTLTANIADTDTKMSSTVVVVTIAGLVGLLMLAKNFIKM